MFGFCALDVEAIRQIQFMRAKLFGTRRPRHHQFRTPERWKTTTHWAQSSKFGVLQPCLVYHCHQLSAGPDTLTVIVGEWDKDVKDYHVDSVFSVVVATLFRRVAVVSGCLNWTTLPPFRLPEALSLPWTVQRTHFGSSTASWRSRWSCGGSEILGSLCSATPWLFF